MFSNAHQPPKLNLRPAKFNRKKLQRVKRSGGRELWERIGVSELEGGTSEQVGRDFWAGNWRLEERKWWKGTGGRELWERNWWKETVGKELEEGKCGKGTGGRERWEGNCGKEAGTVGRQLDEEKWKKETGGT